MKLYRIVSSLLPVLVAGAVASTALTPSPALAGALTTRLAQPQQGLSYVSTSFPTRLLQSTGNLYWTANNYEEFDLSRSSVFRSSKQGVPGQARSLYSVYHHGELGFGALTYAKINGSWYFYVVVNNWNTHTSEIRRLAGGSAVTIARNLTFIGNRDLVTDWSTLFWADEGGVRSMPIGGGAVRTLETGPYFFRIGLDSSRLYFTNQGFIASIPKAGGGALLIVSTTSNITSMFIRPGAPTIVYWGEEDGAVRGRATNSQITTFQAPQANVYAESVSFDGSRLLWTDYNSATRVGRTVYRASGVTHVVASGPYGRWDVQGDSSAMFWASDGVLRYVY